MSGQVSLEYSASAHRIQTFSARPDAKHMIYDCCVKTWMWYLAYLALQAVKSVYGHK